jgi:hypothetical protein
MDKRTNNGLQNITQKTKYRYRVTRTHLNWGELMCFGRVNSSCSPCGHRRVTLVRNPVISHERGKDRIVITTNGTYPWSFVTQIFCNVKTSHDCYRKTFEVTTSTYPLGTLSSVASLVAPYAGAAGILLHIQM